jgi:hypothetical protein
LSPHDRNGQNDAAEKNGTLVHAGDREQQRRGDYEAEATIARRSKDGDVRAQAA